MGAKRHGEVRESTMLRRVWLLATVVLALAATLGGGGSGLQLMPASASAAAPIALDSPGNGEAPLIAYDASTQTTYVAWSNPGPGAGVDLCILPAGASGCLGGAAVLLGDTHYKGYSESNSPRLGGLVVLPSGEVVVVGTPVVEGSIAWASPPGGAAFLTGAQGLQNSGNFISPVSLFYAPGNAVALSSSDVALLDDYAGYFSDSPFAGSSPAIGKPNSNVGGKFPRKPLQSTGAELAAVPAPVPAAPGTDVVVGVGDNFAGPSSEAIPGCLNSAASGYGVSVGKVEGKSGAPGTLNAAGLPPYQLLECAALTPVLASGGQAGIGVVEEQGSGVSGGGSQFTLDYRPFYATSTGGSFGAPVQLADVTSQVLDGVNTLGASEDSGTGVYSLWQDEQGTVLDYSGNAGATWEGPVVVPSPSDSGNVIAGVGNGNAEIAYESNPGAGNQVFLQAANYRELAIGGDSVTTSQTSGVTSGASITITPGTVGETDRASVAGANAAIATGTVSYQLYSAPTCAASSKVFDGGVAAVSGGVAGPSAPVTTALGPGSYYWLASYSGDARNAANSSGCGSEVLTVGPAPNSGYSVSISESTSGVITITITPAQPGEASVVVTISTASIARAKPCKKGQIRLRGRCLPATTVGGKASAKGSAGVPLKLKVTLSSRIRALLAKGKTEHVTATLTYRSAYGGTPSVRVYHLTIKGRKAGHH